MFRNSKLAYGIPAIVIHWISALVVIGLFAVGVWMVELTYYSTWYKTAPHLHKSIGILLLAATIFRLVWRLVNPRLHLRQAINRGKRRPHIWRILLFMSCSLSS